MIHPPTATDRYVVGPMRSAREHLSRAGGSLRRALDESDLLTNPDQRGFIETLILDVGDLANSLDAVMQQIRNAER